VVFVLKVATPQLPWGLSFAGGTIQAAAPALENYCAQARGNELVVVDVVDDLYASTLPLAGLRYALVSGSMSGGQLTMDYPGMGITMSGDQFNHFGAVKPHFEAVLRSWGVDSDEALARLIVSPDPVQLMDVVHAHPVTDFLVPNRYREAARAAEGAGHDWVEAPPEYFLLLARQRLSGRSPLPYTCRM
jgi:hypothetical protein